MKTKCSLITSTVFQIKRTRLRQTTELCALAGLLVPDLNEHVLCVPIA